MPTACSRPCSCALKSQVEARVPDQLVLDGPHLVGGLVQHQFLVTAPAVWLPPRHAQQAAILPSVTPGEEAPHDLCQESRRLARRMLPNVVDYG